MADKNAGARTVTRGRHPSNSATAVKSRPAAGARRAAPRTRPSVTAPRRAGRLGWLGTAGAIALVVGVLCVFGLVMVGSASPVVSLKLYRSPWAIFIRQVMWLGVGTCALLVLAKVDYRKWRTIRGPLVVGTMVLLVLVLVPHFGVTAGGSSRWLGVGMLQLQPSELMKLALVVFAADLLTRRSDPSADPKMVIVPVLSVLGISGLLILKQPDMGTALVLSCIAFGILFMGGVRMGPIMKILGAFSVVAVLVGLADPYRRDRILSFLNPGAHQSGSGYQVWQSLIGLGSGHLFGLGLGGGREKWGTLPNAYTDFIFSVVGEELGLVGAFVLLALFFALAWFGLRTATRAPDRFGSLMAVGITTWIISQAVINIGAVVGVLPVTGIPLPFISFGGSSLIITMAAVGILLNIAAQERATPLGLRSRATTPEAVSRRRFALVAGGGTAGHLQPALAIAEALVEAGHGRETIEFVGSGRGQDRVTLEGRGFPFTLLPGRGIVRSTRPGDVVANIGALVGLSVAAGRGIGVVARARPRVVVSVGGYASLPASLAAVVLGVPLVLVNVDAVPGAANRLLGRFARASAVGWPGNPLPRAVVTGTPVRPEIAAVSREPEDRRAARRTLGLPEGRSTVAVFGGSLGARTINRAAADLADRWKDRDDRSLYHIVGRRDWDEYAHQGSGAAAGGGASGLAVTRVPYEERMAAVYAAADVVVCRAGAMTVAELAVAGVPSVLVPLPGAPGDHQTANARVLEGAGAGKLLPDADCDGEALEITLDGMLVDPPGLDAMGGAASSLGRPEAAAAGARVVEANARPGRPGPSS